MILYPTRRQIRSPSRFQHDDVRQRELGNIIYHHHPLKNAALARYADTIIMIPTPRVLSRYHRPAGAVQREICVWKAWNRILELCGVFHHISSSKGLIQKAAMVPQRVRTGKDFQGVTIIVLSCDYSKLFSLSDWSKATAWAPTRYGIEFRYNRQRIGTVLVDHLILCLPLAVLQTTMPPITRNRRKSRYSFVFLTTTVAASSAIARFGRRC